MWHVVIAAGLVFVELAASCATAQSLPSKQQAAELLEKAENQTRLTAPGSPPFHVFAKIRYKSGAVSLDGTYEVSWAAPDRYREEFRMGTITETDVALKDKLYILRTGPFPAYSQWRVRLLTGLPDRDFPAFRSGVDKVYASQSDGENVVCLELASPRKGQTYCLSSSTGQFVSLANALKTGELTSGLIEDNFISVGASRYPGHMLSSIGDTSLEVDVEKLESVPQFAADAFAPPSGASSNDWCVRPDVGHQQRYVFFALAQAVRMVSSDLANVRAFYAQVAPDGHIEQLAALDDDGAAKVIPTTGFKHKQLPIRRCNGRPIRYETVFAAGSPITVPKMVVPHQ